jgi:hypothetical protein
MITPQVCAGRDCGVLSLAAAYLLVCNLSGERTARRPIQIVSNHDDKPVDRRVSEMNDAMNASLRPAEDVLTYQGKVFISFQNGTYQWVHIKLFSLPSEPSSDQQALGLLLQHVRYRDSYASAKEKDSVILHGPYRLDAITAESFQPTAAESAEATLRAWAESDAPLRSAERDWLERELYPRMHTATSVYRLTGLGKNEWHEWGEVVGVSGFHEFALIDRKAGTLALVVASDD